MTQATVQRMASARIPTDVGQFQLNLYHNSQDGKEHLALIMGNVAEQHDVLVRVHSECFTGDTLGSLRCDCGPQLRLAMEQIADEGRGIILYMRQEGRGIGLLDKLRAYNLQDEGYDTVEANLLLGHQADARDYTLAALILQDLGIQSLRLMTNNPLKMESLQGFGLAITNRVPLQTAVHVHNATYLATKVERMRHLLDLPVQPSPNGYHHQPTIPDEWWHPGEAWANRPFVSLTFAQSLDGSITAQRGRPFAISSTAAMRFTHQVRAAHDGILVGIGTVLADDPSLTVRLVDGRSPQPIILDSHLRYPTTAQLQSPWIVTTDEASVIREKELTDIGARVIRVQGDENGRIHLPTLLQKLPQLGIRSLMVEGGAEVITSFLAAQLVDRLIVTIAPLLIGGLRGVAGLQPHLPRLHNVHHHTLGQDIILIGDLP
jgi:3,4-dihydroxy 2-butanone 4-phosphate synthase/GTP cyclohydrolase II